MWRDRWIAERRKGSLKRDVGMGPLGRLINNNSGYRERLEKLYPLVALYSGIWVGSVDRMMGLGFDQVCGSFRILSSSANFVLTNRK